MSLALLKPSSCLLKLKVKKCARPVGKVSTQAGRELDVAPLVLATVVALGAFQPVLMAPLAFAEEDAAELTPFQKRQQEGEKRRELLRIAREKAALKSGSSASVESLEEPSAASTPIFSSKAAPELKAEAAKPAVAPDSGLSFWDQLSTDAAKPVALEKTAKPAAVEKAVKSEAARKPEVPKLQVAAPKKEEAPKKSNKRSGPLPLFLAQLLVLGGFVGLGAAFTKYRAETDKLLSTVGAKGSELVKLAEAKLAPTFSK